MASKLLNEDEGYFACRLSTRNISFGSRKAFKEFSAAARRSNASPNTKSDANDEVDDDDRSSMDGELV